MVVEVWLWEKALSWVLGGWWGGSSWACLVCAIPCHAYEPDLHSALLVVTTTQVSPPHRLPDMARTFFGFPPPAYDLPHHHTLPPPPHILPCHTTLLLPGPQHTALSHLLCPAVNFALYLPPATIPHHVRCSLVAAFTM